MSFKLLLKSYRHILKITIIGLIVMLIGLAFLQWHLNKTVAHLSAQTSALYQHAFQVNVAAREARFSIIKIQAENLSATLVPKSSDHTAYQKELNQHEALLDKNLSVIEANFLSDMSKVREVRELVRLWHKTHAEFLKLIINERNDEATHVLETKLAPVYEALEQRINYIVNFSEKKAEGIVKQAQVNAESMRSQFLLAVLVFAFFMLTVGTITALRVLKLLHQRDASLNQANYDLRIAATVFESQQGMFITDINSTILRVNNAFTRITGYSAEEALGQTPRLLKSKEHDKTFYTAMWKNINETGGWEGEIWNRHKSGKVYPEQLTITVVKDAAGNATNYVATLTDITERKQTELLIINKEKQLNLVLEGSNLGYWDWDIPSGKVERNHIWAEILGYTHEEIGQTTNQWADFLHPDDVQIARKSISDVLEGRSPAHELVYRMRTKSGDYKWILDRAKVVQRDAEGKAVRMTGSYTDYTERKEIEKRLYENEERLRLAIISANQSWFDLNIATGDILVSPEYAQMLGYDPATFQSNLQQWFENVHPEDINAVREAMQECLRDGGPKSLDYRRKNSAGGWVWFNTIGSVTEWNENHQPLRMIGIQTNITNRKELEFELTRQAHLDYLTGLSNRRHFIEQGETELSRAIRYKRHLSVLMLDIDFFKNVNDTYGHQVGDTVLQVLSKVCQDTLRQVDLIGRIGGEEFAVVLPETPSKEALEVAERLRKAVAKIEVTMPVGLPIHFTVSMGVTTLHDENVNIDMLLHQADTALYEAKKTGRNKVCVT